MPTQPAALSGNSGWKIGGVDSNLYGLTITRATIRDMPPIVGRQEPRPGGHGNIVYPEHYAPRPVILTGHITGDTVAQVQSNFDDLKAVLSTFEVGTPLPLRVVDPLATDRFYQCHYAGQASITEIGPRQFTHVGNVSITLIAEPPFAMAITPDEVDFAATAGVFQTLTTGTFKNPCRVVFKGASTNPKLIFGDSIFICDFDYTTDFTDIEGTTTGATFSGTAAQEAALFFPSAHGFGGSFHLSGAFQLDYTVTGNKSAGSWFFLIEPQFESTASGVKTIFRHQVDANNGFSLLYVNLALGFTKEQDRRFVFAKEISGTNYYLWSTEQNFVSGDLLKMGIDYGSSGMRIFINGSQDVANADTVALGSNPSALSFNANGVDFSAESKIHMAAGFASQLTATEHALIADDPANRIRNRNQVLAYTGTLAADDLLEFTNEDGKYQGNLLDVSAGGNPSTVFPDAGSVIPQLPAANTSVFVSSAAANAYIQYRRRYL